MNICVFCGSRDGHDPRNVRLAVDLGEQIGRHGFGLVYGGGGVGLMGHVGRSARAAGAHVTAVAPTFLVEREGQHQAAADEWVMVDDLLERKRRMVELSQGFIALPGGHGTINEVTEIVSLISMGLLDSRLVLLGAEPHQWSAYSDLIAGVGDAGFIKTDRQTYSIATTAAQAIDLLTTPAGREPT